MDGSPSASDPDREYLAHAEGRSLKSDADQELNDLRVRAYGPYPDIEADPAALARLIDLEAAHVAAAPHPYREARRDVAVATGASRAYAIADGRIAVEQAVPNTARMNDLQPAFSIQSAGPMPRQPAPAAWSRGWFIAGSIAVVVVITTLLFLTWHFGPRPDATLHLTEAETNSDVVEVLEYQGWSVDASTLRQFEPFHDADVWSIENGRGYVCLATWDRSSGRFDTQCVPPRTELALYVTVPEEEDGRFGQRLPEGTFVSLHLRESTVDVYVHEPQMTD